MCRLLMVKSKLPMQPQSRLQDFALMCQKSRTLDGDWQGDGWGIAWLDSQNKWQLKKSLSPIWEDQEKFKNIPKTKLFVSHARSASFSEQKGVIDYNQPYINSGYCFVFNGMLKGVKLRKKIKGEIGAQKIWRLLQWRLKTDHPSQALKNVYEFLKSNTREIEGLNIGLATKDSLFALCDQNCNQEYFALRLMKKKAQQIVCSEEIGPYKFRQMKAGEIVFL